MDLRVKLYDLRNDPGERRNLAEDEEYAAQRASLKRRMDDWFTRLDCGDENMWRNAEQENLPSYRRAMAPRG